VEQVHHLCEAGAAGHRPSFMEAFKVMRRDIDRGDEYVLTGGLGAWETRREMLSGFFIGRDFLYSAHDGVQRSAKSLMLNEAGQCLTHVGRYDDAARVLAKKIEMDGDRQKWGLAAVGCRNLSDTFAIRGRLREACEWMEKSRRFASLDEEARGTLEHVVSAKYGLGYLLSMLGDARGESEFEEAAALRKKLEPQQGRIDPRGVREIRHAEHLVVHGRPEEARALIDDQVAHMGRLRRDADQALSLRVRGDCLHLLGEPSRRSFERAVLLAKQCDETFIKAECELAYIRYLIWKLSPMQEAEVSLRSVRRTCQDYRFELLPVQSYIVEACLQTQHGKLDAAKCAFDRAIDLADPLGYRWPLRLWEVWRGSSRL